MLHSNNKGHFTAERWSANRQSIISAQSDGKRASAAFREAAKRRVRKMKHGLSRRGQKLPPELHMLYSAHARAKKENLPFNLDLSDIHIPNVCPVLGIPLYVGNRKQMWNSPTLDRSIPQLGYVKGNVAVISYRANLLKSNASSSELFKVYEYVKRIEVIDAL